MVKRVYIGLGSNIEQPFLQIKNAIFALNEMPDTKVIRDSGYFKSRPMGPEDQPDYVNAVVEIETQLDAMALLKNCQAIEHQQGRVKTRHWGERTIDLDILLYADQQIENDVLTVPHPGISQRDFVYMPLLRLNAELKVPGLGPLSDVIKQNIAQPVVELAAETTEADYSCQYAGNIDR